MAKKKPKYGGTAFNEYARRILDHPNYAGMPDPIGEKGEIQWEAPSNRKSGKFKDTHHRRREWWRQKALSMGIDPTKESKWISSVAKKIHPFGTKPCKTCGREMLIGYYYPNEHLFNRIRKLSYAADFKLSEIEHICDLIARMHSQFGDQVFKDLPQLFATDAIVIPTLPSDLKAWQNYLVSHYIQLEPRMLSPGAMSNPPDRLDGFHSFNRCCRSTADTGRSKKNLQSYVTDRRTFEYWVDGDWVAADRLMGQVRSSHVFESEVCFNAREGGLHPLPCQADHIGPISLGFSHRPQFQLLCKICNSGKNNRMYATDVEYLRAVEGSGDKVISWFAKEVWDARKNSVTNSESALRLSKLMRDNRHTYMDLLKRILHGNHYMFLASLLQLDAANYNVEFENLRAELHLTKFDKETHIPRTTKYATEQKARRIRIAFASLVDYNIKQNRNAFVISSDAIELEIVKGLELLAKMKAATCGVDASISELLGKDNVPEETLRSIATSLPAALLSLKPAFDAVFAHFGFAMALVGQQLSQMWENERYSRAQGGVLD